MCVVTEQTLSVVLVDKLFRIFFLYIQGKCPNDLLYEYIYIYIYILRSLSIFNLLTMHAVMNIKNVLKCEPKFSVI